MKPTWYGYIFIKWRSYYIVGEVTETDMHNDNGLNPLDATYGTASFNIVYFSKLPPVGVQEDSFSKQDMQFKEPLQLEQLVKKVTDKINNVIEAEYEEGGKHEQKAG